MNGVADRFLKFVRPAGPDECWLWTGSKCSNGYGRFYHIGKARRAPRVAFELAFGAVPAGLYVLHRCDNRACVNPSHLYAGTHQQNMDDRNVRGRARGGRLSGEAHPQAKLRDDDIPAIRAMLAAGLSQRQVAAHFGVNQATVSQRVRANHD